VPRCFVIRTLPILLQLTSFSTLFAAALKYRPNAVILLVCDAVSVWSTSNLTCVNIIWKENSFYLTENLVSIIEITPTLLFKEIIASATYTYILCYRNSRLSSDKVGDITTVFFMYSVVFATLQLVRVRWQILLFPEHHFYVVMILIVLRMRTIMSLVFWDVTSCANVKGLPGLLITHSLSSRRRMWSVRLYESFVNF
jgi:hypothetical protein